MRIQDCRYGLVLLPRTHEQTSGHIIVVRQVEYIQCAVDSCHCACHSIPSSRSAHTELPVHLLPNTEGRQRRGPLATFSHQHQCSEQLPYPTSKHSPLPKQLPGQPVAEGATWPEFPRQPTNAVMTVRVCVDLTFLSLSSI